MLSVYEVGTSNDEFESILNDTVFEGMQQITCYCQSAHIADYLLPTDLHGSSFFAVLYCGKLPAVCHGVELVHVYI